MQAFETSVLFDKKGKLTIEDIPSIKNKKVKLLFLIDEEENSNEFYDLSVKGLTKAYSNDEPEYHVSMIKKPNPLYKNAGR